MLKSEKERILVLRIKKAVGTSKCKTVDIFALVSSKVIRSADYMLSSNIEGALTGHFDYTISCDSMSFDRTLYVFLLIFNYSSNRGESF